MKLLKARKILMVEIEYFVLMVTFLEYKFKKKKKLTKININDANK